MLRRSTIGTLLATVVAALSLPALPASAAETTGSISGVTFEDTNRNGVQDVGETPWAGHVLYLFDGQGSYVRNARSDAEGRYRFDLLPAGTYEIEYAADWWWQLRENWVPTTTGSVQPKQRVVVDGQAAAHFGWRRIVRSTVAAEPVTSFTGPTGLRVNSYNDVIPAQELHDTVISGTVGAEAATTVVRFDLSSSSTTSASIGATAGRYDRCAASVYVSWLSWLDGGPQTLSHEYGHAWGLYRAYLLQQDPKLSDYLAVRGLAADDPRLDTNHAWGRDELLAEDYRQLLGPPAARTASQMNKDLPLASAVPGLREYLVGAFSTSTSAAVPPTAPAALTGTAGNGQIALSWSAPTGTIAGYRVYLGGTGAAVAQVSAPTTTATLSGLTNGVTYAYTVRAYNDGGESANSVTVTVTPQAPPPPPAPLVVDQLTSSSSRTGVTIGFRLSEQAQVTVTVVDRSGALVRTVTDRQTMGAGAGTVQWDGRDSAGRKVRLTGLSAAVRAVALDGRTATASRFLG